MKIAFGSDVFSLFASVQLRFLLILILAIVTELISDIDLRVPCTKRVERDGESSERSRMSASVLKSETA